MSLLFVDTNIWLDFYRARTEAGLQLLNHLDSIRGQIIGTCQVEMEYKKNRQIAMIEGISTLKSPEAIPRPGLFSDAKAVKAIQAAQKQVEKRVKSLKARLQKALADPTRHDPVYKVFQRCMGKEDGLILKQQGKEWATVNRLAFKRFMCGHPPRKSSDTSMGDAINWEWILTCAQRANDVIYIVSRDADYGVIYDGKSYINDFLAHEFRKRVGRRRKIILCHKLSEALKNFQVPVTAEEEEEEQQLIYPRPSSPDTVLPGSSEDFASFQVSPALQSMMEKMTASQNLFKQETIIQSFMQKMTASEKLLEKSSVLQSLTEKITSSQNLFKQSAAYQSLVEKMNVSDKLWKESSILQSLTEKMTSSQDLFKQSAAYQSLVEKINASSMLWAGNPVLQALIEMEDAASHLSNLNPLGSTIGGLPNPMDGNDLEEEE